MIQPPATPTPAAAASARPTRTPVELPALKPGEAITWIKLERPRFALGEIVVGSFAIAGLIVLVSVAIGVLLGHLKSRRRAAEPGGLNLR